MALSNYTELQAAIRTELDKSTSAITDASIVDAITRAEAKVNRADMRLRESQQLAYATYSSGGSTPRRLAVPDDMVELLNLRIKLATAADTDYEIVDYVAPQELSRYYETASNNKFRYTLRKQIEFSHEPLNDHRVMMHYIKKWDIATDTTNWLLTNYPDIYLYGALVECEMHVRNDERVAMWRSFFKDGMKDLRRLAERNQDDAVLDTSEVANLTNGKYFNIITG